LGANSRHASLKFAKLSSDFFCGNALAVCFASQNQVVTFSKAMPSPFAWPSARGNAIKADAQERLEYRRTEEALRAVEVLERLKKLGKQDISR